MTANQKEMQQGETKPNIAIVGGGAAGLMAAVVLSQTGGSRCNILLFEKQERVGKKLLATGNGRCNLSNHHAVPASYGSGASFAKAALQKFSPQRTAAFFQNLGLLTRSEADGKIYPYSNQGGAVLDCLRLAAETGGVRQFAACQVEKLLPKKQGFSLETSCGTFSAHKIIVAAGGCASPQLGGTRDGYRLLEALGHHLTDLFPALVQVKTDSPLPKAMKGVKIEAVATLIQNQKPLATESGEVLFTDYGLSGPPIFRLSRMISREFSHNKEPRLTVSLDLMPEYHETQVRTMLEERTRTLSQLSLEHFLTGMLNKRLGQITLKAAGIAPLSRLVASLENQELRELARRIKGLLLPVSGTTGWSNAQVTAGGISTAEFDGNTLESHLVPGLYAAGEILDIDGPCGGYNLQWAWSSGYLAAQSALCALGEPS